MIIEEFLILNR